MHNLNPFQLVDSSQLLVSPSVLFDIRWVPGHKGILGNELADEAAKLGSKSVRGNIILPLAPATMKRKIHEKIKTSWNREWMPNPDWCRQTKYFYNSVYKRKTDSLLVYG